MAKYTYSNLAHEALQKASFPMTPNELWDFIVSEGLDKKLGSYGKTPEASLSANLYVDTKKQNRFFIFHQRNPRNFGLNQELMNWIQKRCRKISKPKHKMKKE